MATLRQIRHVITKTKIRVPLIWLRHRGLDANDVLLASYPRSGSTMTRFILVEILTGQPSGFDNVNKAIPEMGIQWTALPVLPGEGRLIKTHEPYRKEYKRAVYIVRDMRDVILSQYSREKELGIAYHDFDGYLREFLQGKIAGYGSWHKHIESWFASPLAQSGNMLVIKFDDLRRNTQATVAQILDFLGLTVSPEKIKSAIANNSLEKMREKENNAERLHKTDREDGRFVRKGAVGGWRERMTEAQLELIDQFAGKALALVGYPPGILTGSQKHRELVSQTKD